MRYSNYIVFIYCFCLLSCKAAIVPESHGIVTGADQTNLWLPILKNKTVAVVANPTSTIGKTHLVDSMISLGVNVSCVFAPEHGFRGEAEAGEEVANGTDVKSGVPMISLYGEHKKPRHEELEKIDVIVFDVQDVGARFYTYISTLQYVMEACAEMHKPLLILDRPNPNGSYVDGPVLDTAFRSFIGMQPIPVVYGMTVAEYAGMLNGEHWLQGGLTCDLQVVKLKNWNHETSYSLPVKPSPNLPNDIAVRLYPSLCFFEGTVVSVGRGTDFPFQQFGYPGFPQAQVEFTPHTKGGSTIKPLYDGQLCEGIRLSEKDEKNCIQLKWLIQAYKSSADKKNFFSPFFEKLAGEKTLQTQIENGMSEEAIRSSWENNLVNFKKTRSKYLLYD